MTPILTHKSGKGYFSPRDPGIRSNEEYHATIGSCVVIIHHRDTEFTEVSAFILITSVPSVTLW